MGKYLRDWIEHPVMKLEMIEREFLMMIYRDWRENHPRFAGRHPAEASVIAAGYEAEVDGEIVMTDDGVTFWEGYIAARGEILPGSVVAIAYGRRGYHNG